MDSPVTSTIANIAGRGLGVLAALNSVKQGGLANYFVTRQRMLADPGFRATLAGSPFTAGVFEVGGGMQGPAPAAPGAAAPAAGGVAQPSDGVPAPAQPVAAPGQAVAGGLPAPTAVNVPGYLPGTPRQWLPNLTPYDPKVALEQQGLATTQLGIQSPNDGERAQYKMAGGLPLTGQEMQAAATNARELQRIGGPGTTVQLDIPGMKTNIGSPYNFSAVTSEEYPTMALAQAAAAARNAQLPPGSAGYQVVPSGRGTFLIAPPPTTQQQLPAAPPPPAFRSPGGAATTNTPTTGGPPATVATRTNNPGNIKDGPFARAQPGYVGAGPAATDGGNFAVFDSPASGSTAMSNLLRSPRYQGLTVGDALNRWSNGGYGGDVAANVGIHPERAMSSLNQAELSTLQGGMARREGFTGGAPPPAPAPPAQVAQATPPAPAPTPPRPTRPAAPPPPPPPATPAPTWDPNEVVPHVVVPAPETGYPSAAFGGETPPTVPVPTTTPPPTLPPTTPPAPLPPGRTAVDPTTGLPLAGRTVESQSGSETFTAPNLGDVETQLRLNRAGITDPKLATPAQIANYFSQERTWTNQQKVDAATIERLSRPMNEADTERLRELRDLRSAIDRFDTVYDTPEKRAQFIGPATWARQGLWDRIGMQPRAVADFRTALDPFSLETLSDKDSPLKGDLAALRSSAPSGSDSPATFESRLQTLRDRLDDKIEEQFAFRGVPESEMTADRVKQFRDDQNAVRLAQRLKAFDQPTAEAPPPPAPPPAPDTAYAGPPPTTPPPPPAAPPPWQPTWVH